MIERENDGELLARSSWGSMKTRCQNPNHVYFARYGGRGIRVCKRWQNFECFLADMGPRPGRNYSLDRIDNDGDYEPGNCRWASTKKQGRNTSQNRIIEHNGVRKTLIEWSEEIGIGKTVLRNRLDRGWSVERALTEPVNRGRSKFIGVSWYTNYSKWRATAIVNGRQIHVGYFSSEIEAASARRKYLEETTP